jgi:hypothetical protein
MSWSTACVFPGVGKGLGGNRAVPPRVLLGMRGDLSGARAEAIPKEGGSWGKHGFPHRSERQLATGQEEAVAAARV